MQHPSVQKMLLSSLYGILKLWASTAVPVAALAWLLTWRPRPRVIGKGD
jgi:hypothetical protein